MQNAMERSMVGIKLKDRVKLTKIKNILRHNTNIKYVIKRLKWKWAGHLVRYEGERWAKKSHLLVFGQQQEEKRAKK